MYKIEEWNEFYVVWLLLINVFVFLMVIWFCVIYNDWILNLGFYGDNDYFCF